MSAMSRVKQWFRNLSLAHKLSAIGVITTGLSLALACAVLLMLSISRERTRLVRQIDTIANVAGIGSTATLTFGDAKAAGETLAAMHVIPNVVTAAMLLRDGRILARFDRDPNHPVAVMVDEATLQRAQPWHVFSGESLLLTRPILLGGEAIGTVYVESDLQQARARNVQY